MPTAGHEPVAILAACRAAAEANRRTPGRRGNVVELAGPGDIVIAGDLHGDRRNFEAILAHAALDEHPERHLLMQEVCHGGPCYPEGAGCMSHLMLEDVIQLKVRYGERFHFLLSNHELAELTDYPIIKGMRLLNLHFRCGMQTMYREETEQVRQGYLEFLASCPLAVRIGGEVLVTHSLPALTDLQGFDPTVLERELTADDLQQSGSVFRMMWGRDYRPQNAGAFADLVHARALIHGHEPCPEGYRAPNECQLIVDGQGDQAAFLLLPLAGPFDHAALLAAVRRVHPAG